MLVTTLCATLETPFPWPRHSVSSLDLSTHTKIDLYLMLKMGSKLSVLFGLALLCVSLLQSLLGKLMRRDLKFTSRQIQPSCNFSINPTESKRTISKRNRKRLFWKGYSVESPLLTSEIAKYTLLVC